VENNPSETELILSTSSLLKYMTFGTGHQFKKRKSPFLIIQLLPQYGFGHRTPKPGIFDHPTLKTVYNWP
jgi:hypothetical protein